MAATSELEAGPLWAEQRHLPGLIRYLYVDSSFRRTPTMMIRPVFSSIS